MTPGTRVGPYEVVASIGAGGMGEVFRARDTRLDRDVALKILPVAAAADPDRRRRFEQEARAVSRLNHPGIVTLFDIESSEGPSGRQDVLVMELVPGESLDRRLRSGPLPVATAVDIAAQIAEALDAAHAAGVTHRDLKPANLMLLPSGRIKVLDFGLARLEGPPISPDAETVEGRSGTVLGALLGTAGYLSPEQAAGERADARSDLFALGVVLYEMITGASPFKRPSTVRALAAVVSEAPPPLASLRRDVPPALSHLVERCLAKAPADRPESAAVVAAALSAIAGAGKARPSSTRGLWIGAAAGALAVIAALAVWWMSGRDARWVRDQALPELAHLVEGDRLFDAFVLAREIDRRSPGDPALASLLPAFAAPARIDSAPAGAEVAIKDYTTPDAPWQTLGRTPLTLTLPTRPLRFRVIADGRDPVESAALPEVDDEGRLWFRFDLLPSGSAPANMVRVKGGPVSFGGTPSVPVEDFWIDRLEVTNAQYQKFVDAGGYQRPEYWPTSAAVTQYVDATGRPGPSTWEGGRFPDGTADHPVGGVSWYEATAYATWADRSLPTYHHWFRAALPDVFSEILSLSRIGGDGPVAAGTMPGLGPWGTSDMAGNVKEWVWSAAGDLRYALGAAWSDPPYLFAEPEAFPPHRRTPDLGFRTARFERPPDPVTLADVQRAGPPGADLRPISDEVFAAVSGVYSYNRDTPLAATIDGRDNASPLWQVERVSVAAAYGGERLPILLFIPRAEQRRGTVMFFPESTAEQTHRSADLATRWFDFLVRAGYVVAVPIYKNTFERLPAQPPPWSPTLRRDLLIAWSRDLGRAIDYLETRPDLGAGKLAFYGFSLGAVYGPVLTALEPRFKASVLLGGGLTGTPLPAEAMPINFAPRVRAPTLMIAGREDFVRPVETHQRPLFEWLGPPPSQKRLAVLEGGHLPPRMTDVMREVLAWLDRWLQD